MRFPSLLASVFALSVFAAEAPQVSLRPGEGALEVLIDGKEAAVSPVMRVKTSAWHFDVPIPAGARRLSLVAMDAGNGSREDFADWAEAGFVVQR